MKENNVTTAGSSGKALGQARHRRIGASRGGLRKQRPEPDIQKTYIDKYTHTQAFNWLWDAQP